MLQEPRGHLQALRGLIAAEYIPGGFMGKVCVGGDVDRGASNHLGAGGDHRFRSVRHECHVRRDRENETAAFPLRIDDF